MVDFAGRARRAALVVGLAILPVGATRSGAATVYDLIAISGGDGAFERVEDEGRVILRGRKEEGKFAPFLYFQVPPNAPKRGEAAYLEVTYRDVGVGRMSVQYSGREPDGAYRQAEPGYDRFLGDSRTVRTAVFRLDGPDFRQRQNLKADLRVCAPSRDVPLQVVKAALSYEPTPRFLERDAKPWLAPYRGPSRSDIDASTLTHKVLCGYQGWFRCPGDPAEQGWRHWSRDALKIRPDTVTFEMWPDLSEFSAGEKYPTPEFLGPDGKPAALFSSDNPKTVDRHFEWMRQYGIDGVFPQRFLVGVRDPSGDRVLAQVRDAANRTGRVFAVCYDLSGAREDKILSLLTEDWTRLVDEVKITRDARYLHHQGKPVLFVWGFFSDRFRPAVAHRIIDFFKRDSAYSVTLIGGCPWYWRKERDPEWARAYRRFDVVSPWNVGNVARIDGRKHAATGSWADDMAEAKRAGMAFFPVIYPGFGWTNLKGKGSDAATVPRLGGEVYRRQFLTASALGVEMAYVAMFDEVDEGTAIFKVSNTPPRPGTFQTFEGLPSDWYLRLTGAGSRLIRREPVSWPVPPTAPPPRR